MIVNKEFKEAFRVLDNMLDALQAGLPTRGTSGSELRRVVGNFQAHKTELVESMTIGTELFKCFEQARLAGSTLDSLDNVRNVMVAEHGIYTFGLACKLVGMVFSFVEQCIIISQIEFQSRIDVQDMIIRMNAVIEIIKLETAELLDGIDYQGVIQLSATLLQHLMSTELKLPQVVKYRMPTPQPAFTLANYLYGDGARYEELIIENRIINPNFFTLNIRALSQ